MKRELLLLGQAREMISALSMVILYLMHLIILIAVTCCPVVLAFHDKPRDSAVFLLKH